jgi:hypothetical protein
MRMSSRCFAVESPLRTLSLPESVRDDPIIRQKIRRSPLLEFPMSRRSRSEEHLRHRMLHSATRDKDAHAPSPRRSTPASSDFVIGLCTGAQADPIDVAIEVCSSAIPLDAACTKKSYTYSLPRWPNYFMALANSSRIALGRHGRNIISYALLDRISLPLSARTFASSKRFQSPSGIARWLDTGDGF